MIDLRNFWREVRDLPNVWGYSHELKPKIVNGEETDEDSIRIYVHKKIDEKHLNDKHIVPKEFEGIKTDLIKKKRPASPPPGLEVEPKKKAKTDRIRPVIYGISLGNWKITAGTGGAPYKSKDHGYLVGTNAHVGTPDPSKEPGEIEEKRWVQPGKYDDGTLEDIVADYVWHKQIHPLSGGSGCPVARIWAGVYNAFSRLFGRKTRLRPTIEEPNHIDFSVGEPQKDIGFENRFYDDIGSWKDLGILGHWFAGSRDVSIGCKVKYIRKEGYEPLILKPTEAEKGLKVGKSGRTTCEKWGKITDASATVRVSYGSFIAEFEDVYHAEPILKGGDSGSATITRLK